MQQNMLYNTWTGPSFLSNARIVLCQKRIKVFSIPGTIDPLRPGALDGVQAPLGRTASTHPHELRGTNCMSHWNEQRETRVPSKCTCCWWAFPSVQAVSLVAPFRRALACSCVSVNGPVCKHPLSGNVATTRNFPGIHQ